MGWWSATIMGGDEPSDALSNLARQLGLGNENTWNDNVATARGVLSEQPLPAKMAMLSAADAQGIAAQVMAYMHMAVGAKLEPILREAACLACRMEILDGWHDPEVRRTELTAFISMVTDYDDVTPVVFLM